MDSGSWRATTFPLVPLASNLLPSTPRLPSREVLVRNLSKLLLPQGLAQWGGQGALLPSDQHLLNDQHLLREDQHLLREDQHLLRDPLQQESSPEANSCQPPASSSSLSSSNSSLSSSRSS